jgi:hypothetical protein
VPTLTLHVINGDSAGNFNLLDEESTGGMVIQSGIISDEDSTRGMGISWVLPAHRRGIHQRQGIPPGMTCSTPLIQAGKIKMRGKFSKH